jgi:hypothetical protein
MKRSFLILIGAVSVTFILLSAAAVNGKHSGPTGWNNLKLADGVPLPPPTQPPPKLTGTTVADGVPLPPPTQPPPKLSGSLVADGVPLPPPTQPPPKNSARS